MATTIDETALMWVHYFFMKGGVVVEEKQFKKPVCKKGKSKVTFIVCKRAACNSGSAHISTTHLRAREVKLEKSA